VYRYVRWGYRSRPTASPQSGHTHPMPSSSSHSEQCALHPISRAIESKGAPYQYLTQYSPCKEKKSLPSTLLQTIRLSPFSSSCQVQGRHYPTHHSRPWPLLHPHQATPRRQLGRWSKRRHTFSMSPLTHSFHFHDRGGSSTHASWPHVLQFGFANLRVRREGQLERKGSG